MKNFSTVSYIISICTFDQHTHVSIVNNIKIDSNKVKMYKKSTLFPIITASVMLIILTYMFSRIFLMNDSF